MAVKKPRNKQKSVRQMLDIIDAYLVRNTSKSGQLWDVLSALRGPDDDESNTLKEGLTIPIRSKAFPKTAKEDSTTSLGNVHAFFSSGAKPKRYLLGSSGHFTRHASDALDVLFPRVK